VTALVLADLALIVFAVRLAGALMRRIGQPPVVGELAVGIVLGPTLLGGTLTHAMFPLAVRSALGAVANVGLVLFMFAVGYDVDRHALRGRLRATAGIALGSTLLPLALGVGLAGWLAHTRYHPARPAAFVAFLGLAMSITALPVLARILADRRMSGTLAGSLALAGAAAVDIASWSALSVLLAVVSGVTPYRLAYLVPYLAVMVLVVRPVLGAVTRRSPRFTFAFVLGGVFLSAAATEWLGLHYVFGALLFGVLLPRDNPQLREQVEELTRVGTLVLLPVFFVVAALAVDLTGLGRTGLAELGLILTVAIGGKMLGTYAGARAGRLAPGPAGTVAVLMNARGLTEIVVLQIGLQFGLLNTRLYSLMVLMALITTAMTGPLLWLGRRRRAVAGGGTGDGTADDGTVAGTVRPYARTP